ncbi:MAG: Asp-tRNA(Asn)/Glu-tRNA(Gln) amidotransferase subunit GatC [Flammeovirgaceae bacterium]|nr:MAG: Asp-tRNA(Asn)/Glu-tRNA(Gln) amidotransferase subunit GatC [Flammeovirgaceae bacterium]
MQLDSNLLDKLAHLARLELKPEEADTMLADMNAILAWVEKLHEVDTTGVEPLTSMSHEINAFREDEVGKHLDRSEALSQAPATNGTFFKVPKVIE